MSENSKFDFENRKPWLLHNARSRVVGIHYGRWKEAKEITFKREDVEEIYEALEMANELQSYTVQLKRDHQILLEAYKEQGLKATILQSWADQVKKIRWLKEEITDLKETLHRKNLALEAYDHVWCDGGCAGGVHRYDDLGPDTITEEIVQSAIRNTERLKRWWANRQGRLARIEAEKQKEQQNNV